MRRRGSRPRKRDPLGAGTRILWFVAVGLAVAFAVQALVDARLF